MKTPPTLDIDPGAAKAIGGELAAMSEGLAERLAASLVVDQASLAQAVLDREQIGEAAKRIEAFFAPFTKMAEQLHKALVARKNAILAPLLQLDGAKRDAIRDYDVAEGRRRQQREAEESAARKRETEAAAAREAAALESVGEHALAAGVIAEAIAAPAPVVVRRDEVRDVARFRREWKWRLQNRALVPAEFTMLDEKKIGAYARSMKDTGRIPGVEIYYEDVPIR